MLLFKVDKTFTGKSIPDKGYNPNKVRYVVNKDGKGRWIRPPQVKRLPYDYDEDVIY